MAKGPKKPMGALGRGLIKVAGAKTSSSKSGSSSKGGRKGK